MSRHYFFNLPTPQWENEGPAVTMTTSTMRTVSASGGRPSPASESGWIGHREALGRLGLNARTVAKLMARTAPADAPWIDIGSGTQHHYRWKADALDAWLLRVAGGTVADERRKPARPLRGRKRKPSRREAKGGTETTARSQLGQSGSLVRLVVDNSDARS